MKHPLLVGHFDTNVRSLRPKVKRALDLDKVLAIFAEHCDKGPDDMPLMATSSPASAETTWFGRIGSEDVLFKDGYLICPWLGWDFNEAAVKFIAGLHKALNVEIFEPGDGVFFSPEHLRSTKDEFHRAPTKAKKAR